MVYKIFSVQERIHLILTYLFDRSYKNDEVDKDGYYLPSTYSVPSLMLSTLHILSYLIPSISWEIGISLPSSMRKLRLENSK